MTREEFREQVTCMSELIDFCSGTGYDSHVENVFDDRAKDDWYDEMLTDWARECNWRELKDRLDEIPEGADWYYRNDWGEFEPLYDGEIEDIINDVYREAVEDGYFDEEEEEEAPEPLEEPDGEEPEEEEEVFEIEDFSIFEGVMAESLSVVAAAKQRAKEQDDLISDALSALWE